MLRGPPQLQILEEIAPGHNKETSDGTDEGEGDNEKPPATDGKDTLKEIEKHYIDFGPQWRSKVPPFEVRVHSPEKRIPPVIAGGAGAAYTMYSVTSTFDDPQDLSFSDHEHSRTSSSSPSAVKAASSSQSAYHQMTVHRRFSHFVFLHATLARLLPGIALPPLPEKQYAGRFSDAFVEARRADLQRYLSKVVRHPLARYAEVMMFFLGCESDFVSIKFSMPPARFIDTRDISE